MTSTARLLLAVAVGVASPAAAETEVRASVTTLFLARPQVVRGVAQSNAPLIEIVDLSARNRELGFADDLGFKFVGWGRWNVLGTASPRLDYGTNKLGADVQLAFAEARFLERRLLVRAGRQLIFDGSAPRVVHLDGGSVDARLSSGLGVRAYGGIPVSPGFGYRPYDAQLGSRVYYAPRFDSEVGASWSLGLIGRRVVRHDVGLDGRWTPLRALDLIGSAHFSLADSRLIEAELTPRYRVSHKLQVFATVRRTSPDLWLPRTSIFTVFSDDERDELGAGVFWEPLSFLELDADGRFLRLAAGNGADLNARATATVGPARTRVGAQLRWLRIPDNGYFQSRLWAQQRLSRQLVVSGDLDGFFFAEPLNGRSSAFSATGAISWGLGDGWRAGLAGVAATTTTFNSRFELLAKLGYDFSTAPRAPGSR